MSLKRSRRVSKTPSIASDDASSFSDSSDDESEVEVTLNILERKPRITAGKRSKVISGEEAQTDSIFWGSDQHRTWEESESDSESSESESSSALDEDEEESEAESEERDESDTAARGRRKFKAYVDPKDKPVTKPRVKRTVVKKKPLPESESKVERVATRDTTRARTNEVSVRVERVAKKQRIFKKERDNEVPWSQEELLEEARLTEEWNTADLQAYIRYTELSDKERAAHIKPKKGNGKVFRSYIENDQVKSEIRVVGGKSITFEDPVFPLRSGFKYRYPYDDSQLFNTASEFEAIHQKFRSREEEAIKKIISDLGNKFS